MLRVTVVYDNEAEPGFSGSWGFSALVETGNTKLLFDAGWDGCLLLENLKKLGRSPSDIQKLVLSHQHWDHTGGVPELLKANPDLTVYVPSAFSKNLKAEIAKRAKLVEVGSECEIALGIYSTGELGDKIREQALVLDSGNGFYVLSGCAHPGLAEILEAALCFGKVKGIIGGLHGSREFERLEGLELIAAGHCTTHKKEIKELFPSRFLKIGAGLCLELD